MSRESPFMRRLMVRIGSSPEATIWRQNPGMAFVGYDDRAKGLLHALAKPRERALIVPPGRALCQPINMGPPAGTGDFIGFSMTTGAGLGGQYLEIETKALKGHVRDAQMRRREFVLSHGGIYLECRPLQGETDEEAAERSARELFEEIVRRRR